MKFVHTSDLVFNVDTYDDTSVKIMKKYHLWLCPDPKSKIGLNSL